jgi:cysteinyl-tRNA synthetase
MLSSNISDEDKLATLIECDMILGLDIERSVLEISNTSIPDAIQDLANKRIEARNAKDWSLSDKIRDEIQELGYIVKDTGQGQTISKK